MVTGDDGLYVVPIVTAGTYTIVAEMHGFRTRTQTGVALSGGDRVVVDLPLDVSMAESVDVTAPVILQAASGERSSVVDTTQLEHLPIAGHDFQQFVALTPGVFGARRIGGGGQDNYMIDGVSAMDTGNNTLLGGLNLPIDAVAEVKVVTSAYQAEYGRSSGLQVSAVTRSGTNKLKFSLFSYERQSDEVVHALG